jgi:hypothetical protein
MVAGIVLQSGEKKSGGEPPHFAGTARWLLFGELAARVEAVEVEDRV